MTSRGNLFDIDPDALEAERPAPIVSHPVYSDFSHIAVATGIGSTRFAVGLRESNPEELLHRILPLAKVVPGQKRERVIREKKKEEKVCTKPDCVARRETFAEMNNENEYLRVRLREVESRVAAAKNRVALSEKSVDVAESRNELLRGQIDEAQAKILNIESIVEKGEARNQVLRGQFKTLLADIEALKEQADLYRRQMETILAYDSGPQVVFSRPGDSISVQNLRREVESLESRNTEIDSDDD